LLPAGSFLLLALLLFCWLPPPPPPAFWPGFDPAGPVLVLPDSDDLRRMSWPSGVCWNKMKNSLLRIYSWDVLKIKLTIKEDNLQLTDIFIEVANCPANEDFRTEND
jgi:hypothetical protein